ncbi:MAG: Zn-dependent hydrolase [Firmicutes bacterium]|nr:Zn-dependent hydrolase [Bacillota bacterium]
MSLKETVTIDGPALLEQIAILGNIGRLPREQGGGLDRRSYGPAWQQAVQTVRSWMQEAGLNTRLDAAGNLIGRLGSTGPALVVGSHLDTVPNGGPLDGAYGVLAGVALAKALQQSGLSLHHALEVIAFADEEGRVGGGLFGSRCMAGLIPAEELQPTSLLYQALTQAGIDPQQIFSAARAPEEFAAYLELHIEQGGRLACRGLKAAAVEGIVGIHRFQARFFGEQNHAGATEMRARRDAGLAAARFMLAFRDRILAAGDRFVGTTGSLVVQPGAVNVIPGYAEVNGEFRSIDETGLAALDEEVPILSNAAAVQEGCRSEICFLEREAVTHCDPTIVDLIEATARAYLGENAVTRLESRAGHDTQSMAHLCPAAMIFVPSDNGKSHVPDELTSDTALVHGAQVLLQTLLVLDKQL